MSKKMECMKYTTVNKLRKENKLSDNEIIGGKLTSEKAKELYKNNIRVHHKHYIPKDKKKYFYEQEISGGRINLSKAFKKFGSTVKHTFENVGKQTALGIDKVKTGIEDFGHTAERKLKRGFEAVKDFGENAVDKIEEYGDVVLHGRNDYPPKVRSLIEQYGDKPITSITIDRTPVPDLLTGALNAVSFGAFKKRLSRTPYDKLFHLRLDLTFDDNKKLAVEKNEVINMYENPKRLKGSEQKQISLIPQGLTLNKMLEEGQKIQGNKWFRYSAYNNNCQDFIVALLKGSNIGSPEDLNFVKQNTASLFKGDSFLRKFANTVTDIGGKVNEITTGAGFEDESEASDSEEGGIIQSIVFDKEHWTIKKAIKWLEKHGYTGLECDEKENTLRFRQIEPSKNYNYITKSLPNNIELIIAYKKILSNNKYNKMPKKHSRKYESDSSDSDSDSDIEGRGFLREKKIIKKLNEIKREIEEHQNMHGGKINIGKAFKKLGSTIKKGFESKIAKPFERDVIKPSEKALVPLANKTADYVTAKKGGLASDLITYGIPAASSAVLGGLAGLATGGNPVAGVAASALGSKLGSMGASELKKATGTGAKRRGRPPKGINSKGDLVHIDIASHDDSPMKGGKLKRARNTALEQLLTAKKEKDAKELQKNLLELSKTAGQDLKAIRTRIGAGFKKGSPEAKEHMARLRAMRGKK